MIIYLPIQIISSQLLYIILSLDIFFAASQLNGYSQQPDELQLAADETRTGGQLRELDELDAAVK